MDSPTQQREHQSTFLGIPPEVRDMIHSIRIEKDIKLLRILPNTKGTVTGIHSLALVCKQIHQEFRGTVNRNMNRIAANDTTRIVAKVANFDFKPLQTFLDSFLSSNVSKDPTCAIENRLEVRFTVSPAWSRHGVELKSIFAFNEWCRMKKRGGIEIDPWHFRYVVDEAANWRRTKFAPRFLDVSDDSEDSDSSDDSDESDDDDGDMQWWGRAAAAFGGYFAHCISAEEEALRRGEFTGMGMAKETSPKAAVTKPDAGSNELDADGAKTPERSGETGMGESMIAEVVAGLHAHAAGVQASAEADEWQAVIQSNFQTPLEPSSGPISEGDFEIAFMETDDEGEEWDEGDGADEMGLEDDDGD